MGGKSANRAGNEKSTSVRSRTQRRVPRRSIAGLLVAAVWLVAGIASADPIPFDAETQSDGFSYGYQNPGNYGITNFKPMDAYYTASRSDDTANRDAALLWVDPVSYERCPRASDGCNADFHVFDVEWDVTFNASAIGDPGSTHLVDLILVDSDPDADFNDLLVQVEYEQVAELDGASLSFETASYRNGAFYFIAAALGAMTDGETQRLAFSYTVEGELPLADDEVGFLFPTILPAAYLPVPEPGTGIMMGLGLVALAKRGRRNA